MANAATFNFANWVLRYPEFAALDPALAQLYFNEAGIYLDNSGGNVVQTDIQQLTLMNMLTAHIAALNSPGTSSPLVGRVSTASEGSVSVGTDNQYPPGTVQWYQQTKYGAAYWVATSQYRTMMYTPGPVLPVSARNQLAGNPGIPFWARPR